MNMYVCARPRSAGTRMVSWFSLQLRLWRDPPKTPLSRILAKRQADVGRDHALADLTRAAVRGRSVSSPRTPLRSPPVSRTMLCYTIIIYYKMPGVFLQKWRVMKKEYWVSGRCVPRDQRSSQPNQPTPRDQPNQTKVQRPTNPDPEKLYACVIASPSRIGEKRLCEFERALRVLALRSRQPGRRSSVCPLRRERGA